MEHALTELLRQLSMDAATGYWRVHSASGCVRLRHFALKPADIVKTAGNNALSRRKRRKPLENDRWKTDSALLLLKSVY